MLCYLPEFHPFYWQWSTDTHEDIQVYRYGTVHDVLRYGRRPLPQTVRYGPHVDLLFSSNGAFLPGPPFANMVYFNPSMDK